MKNILITFVALLLVTGIASAQQGVDIQKSYVYYISKITKNTHDTIPGNEVGGTGHGKVGWLFVDNDNVDMIVTAQDSVNIYWTVEYCDSGYVGATGTSAYDVGHKTVTRTVAADTLYTKTTGALGKVLRDRNAGTDVIPGARWIRLDFFATNSDEQKLKSTGYAFKVKIRRWK